MVPWFKTSSHFHCAFHVFVTAWSILLLTKVELQNLPKCHNVRCPDRGCWVADEKSFGKRSKSVPGGISLTLVDAIQAPSASCSNRLLFAMIYRQLVLKLTGRQKNETDEAPHNSRDNLRLADPRAQLSAICVSSLFAFALETHLLIPGQSGPSAKMTQSS